MVGYVIGGVLAIIAAVLAVRLLMQKKRIAMLAEQMEDYLTGCGKPGKRRMKPCRQSSWTWACRTAME